MDMSIFCVYVHIWVRICLRFHVHVSFNGQLSGMDIYMDMEREIGTEPFIQPLAFVSKIKRIPLLTRKFLLLFWCVLVLYFPIQYITLP